MSSSTERFTRARDFLLAHREDPAAARADFRWPEFETFNWALDHFDAMAAGNDRPALIVVHEDGREERLSFAELSARSNQVANYLRRQGVKRGEAVLIMLPNVVPLWEVMLAGIKLGAVIIPATTMLTSEDLDDRLERGQVRHVVTDQACCDKFADSPRAFGRVLVDGPVEGWADYAEARAESTTFAPDGPTPADAPLMLYFTSGTTAKPKMVQHSHQSYPAGHLSTMYWLGLREGDRHLNISSPGWGKHAWSNFFGPWNAGATIFIYQYQRFDARKVLEAIVRHEVTTLCAPPTVWRSLILEDLKAYPVRLRELVSAGEPLNPEVIEQVRAAWNLTVREGYGQTETTCQIGTPPSMAVRPGAMGLPLPGYRVVLLDADDHETEEGEIALDLEAAPLGLMKGYFADPERTRAALGGRYYRTGDVARRDADGYLWYVGRADDVFKSSDYRISPFELESILVEHPLVAESAVIPSPDPRRLSVPKAIVTTVPGTTPSRELALDILRYCRVHLAPFKRVRRIEFAELPKTISGKIRRVELRQTEERRYQAKERGEREFWEEDFPELKSGV